MTSLFHARNKDKLNFLSQPSSYHLSIEKGHLQKSYIKENYLAAGPQPHLLARVSRVHRHLFLSIHEPDGSKPTQLACPYTPLKSKHSLSLHASHARRLITHNLHIHTCIDKSGQMLHTRMQCIITHKMHRCWGKQPANSLHGTTTTTLFSTE